MEKFEANNTKATNGILSTMRRKMAQRNKILGKRIKQDSNELLNKVEALYTTFESLMIKTHTQRAHNRS